MHILTAENKSYNLDSVPDEVDNLDFCVLDLTDTSYIDFYFLPMVFLESFHAPALCLDIAGRQLQMPMDWSMLITDEELSSIEVIPLTSLNNRGLHTVLMNPLDNIMPKAAPVYITNIYHDVKWYFPKLKTGHMLVVPLENTAKPRCAIFVKELTKIPNVIDLADLVV